MSLRMRGMRTATSGGTNAGEGFDIRENMEFVRTVA